MTIDDSRPDSSTCPATMAADGTALTQSPSSRTTYGSVSVFQQRYQSPRAPGTGGLSSVAGSNYASSAHGSSTSRSSGWSSITSSSSISNYSGRFIAGMHGSRHANDIKERQNPTTGVVVVHHNRPNPATDEPRGSELEGYYK